MKEQPRCASILAPHVDVNAPVMTAKDGVFGGRSTPEPPLHHAIRLGHGPLLRTLLRVNANPEALDSQGWVSLPLLSCA